MNEHVAVVWLSSSFLSYESYLKIDASVRWSNAMQTIGQVDTYVLGAQGVDSLVTQGNPADALASHRANVGEKSSSKEVIRHLPQSRYHDQTEINLRNAQTAPARKSFSTRFDSAVNRPQKQPAMYWQRALQSSVVAESQGYRQLEPHWMGMGITGLLVCGLIVLYGLYYRASRKQRKVQQQYDQLSVLMKELHHRAKNNLAIVSSLLFLQANYLEDEEIVQQIRVIQQRVEAMLLIHQRLYLGNQTTIVNIREYLTDLAESLLKAYGHPVLSFDLRLEIDLVDLDADIAIPLGLLVNELLTNSFKYAYDACQEPMLRIALHRAGGVKQGGIVLEVQDNGPGIDMADWQKEGNRKSFGKKLISLLVQQLDGQFDLVKQDGTLFTVYIPHPSQNRLRTRT